MSPSTLTVGPRGRRVLLQLAGMCDDGISHVAAALAHSMETHEGSWLLQIDESDATDPSEPGGRLREEALPSLAEFAQSLEALNLSENGPSEEQLYDAVATSVADARYWQKPSGYDVLTSQKELRRPFRRLAAWAAAAAPEWWTGAMHAKQSVVTWNSPELPALVPIEEWKQGVLAGEEQAKAATSSDIPSRGGPWWSHPDALVSTRMPLNTAKNWTENHPGTTQYVRSIDTANARVLEIEDTSAWVTLCWDRPLEVTATRGPNWEQVTGRADRWIIPDWAGLARHYDAVHLHTRAYLAGATQTLTVDTGILTMIAGWGPDETRWLNPPQISAEVTRIEGVG